MKVISALCNCGLHKARVKKMQLASECDGQLHLEDLKIFLPQSLKPYSRECCSREGTKALCVKFSTDLQILKHNLPANTFHNHDSIYEVRSSLPIKLARTAQTFAIYSVESHQSNSRDPGRHPTLHLPTWLYSVLVGASHCPHGSPRVSSRHEY